mgnify:CR=1 FL=1
MSKKKQPKQHGAARTGPGRPPLQPREGRERPLWIRLSKEERRACEAGAKATGETLSAWARRILKLQDGVY